MTVQLYLGDCLDILPGLAADSVDTIITDPPYGLEFMGKDWDRGVPGVRFWREALRVAKPGATMLAFGGTRTHHRLMCAIEDAGWELRDVMMWVYGSGFPKSHDISKAIDKAAGAEGEVVGWNKNHRGGHGGQTPTLVGVWSCEGAQPHTGDGRITAPATPEAAEWEGWGTALKPAWEPIIVAMKPRDGTFANNALTWGVAGLWIDGGRIPTNGESWSYPNGPGGCKSSEFHYHNRAETPAQSHPSGRWPANLILDEAAAEMLGAQSGESKSTDRPRHNTMEAHNRTASMGKSSGDWITAGHNDTGTAARYFKTFPVSNSTSVDIPVFLWYDTEKQEVDQCCEIASIAVLNSTLNHMMSSGDLGAFAAGLVPMPAAENGGNTTHGDSKTSGMGGGIDTGAKVKAEKSTDNLSTDGPGNLPTDQYLTGTTFTTLTATTRTTTCPTCGASLHLSITPCTNGKEKTTKSVMMELSADCAHGANNTGPLDNSTSEPQELIKAIVRIASANHSDSGARQTENTTTPICESTISNTNPARFLYCAKASRAERTNNGAIENKHPTVKPLELMRYLCRLTKTPAGGVVLDPFMGSGSTGVAAVEEGRPFIGIEKERPAYETAEQRIEAAKAEAQLQPALEGL